MSRHTLRWAALALACAMGLAACGPGPKPPELRELELMRAEAVTDPTIQGNPNLDEAEKYYKMATESWQDSEEERAAEYALLGQIRIDTARVTQRRLEAEAKLKSAKARLGELSQTAAGLKKDQVTLEQQIVLLEAEKTRLEAAEASNAQANAQEQAQLTEALLAVEAEIAKAQAVNAAEHAKGTWGMAENTYNMAKQYESQGNVKQAMKLAGEARVAFQKAAEEARPKWEQAKFEQSREGKIQKLQNDAKQSFRVDAVPRDDGVIVVMPRLFERKKSEPMEGRSFLLKMAVDLAQSQPETSILIEGHTQSKGREDKNEELSAERAAAVRNYFLAQGVDGSRIRTLSFGENRPRYSNDDKDERGKNDRVEIVLRVPPE